VHFIIIGFQFLPSSACFLVTQSINNRKWIIINVTTAIIRELLVLLNMECTWETETGSDLPMLGVVVVVVVDDDE
jgi:hypothetical protein